MSCFAISDNIIAVAKGLRIDCYDYFSHTYIDAPSPLKTIENDQINDLAISVDSKYLAVITSASKQLIVYSLPLSNKENCKNFVLPRSASKIRFSANNEEILVADKSGDVLIYNINHEDTGNKLLGHLSLLLDVLQTNDSRYIITCDRDEKIRVSCYPNTYNIQTFCLGHKEFVNHIEILTHNDGILTSTSGDGTVKFWDYVQGRLCYNIDTNLDVNEEQVKINFCKVMDEDGVEVSTLPIVHYTLTRVDETCSLLAVLLHTYNELLLYKLHSFDMKFSHKLVDKFTLDHFPTAIKFHKSSLFVCDDVDSNVKIFKIVEKGQEISLQLDSKINIFDNIISSENENFAYIKVLYKRKFDNVQEYQERKKQRLEKNTK